ncbi:hypothetical protein Hamer_G028851 [Homarus americanus]|uniref:CCHC-type domain-containing protein n=1 Tax=Homarus americanus TaxID=6706 RepID=A0A8J5MR91_HOMAM|nr:hypothetical protein Hamer_G028851 [Homarus americanus]
MFGDSVDVGLREDHGEASQVNVAESRSVNDELRLLESQLKLKEAIERRVGIRQAEAEAKAKEAEAIAKEVQRTFNPSLHRARQGNTNTSNFVRDRRSWTRSPPNGASKFSTYPCSYCGKPGHKAEFCWTRLQLNTGKPAMIITKETNTSPVGVMAGLSKADSMPIGLISTKTEARESAVSVLASRDFDLFQESFAKDPDVGTFRPFLSQGTVEVDGVETPVTILRDSGCLQTLIKEGVVAARKTDKYFVFRSLWGQGVAPLVLVRVTSSCFSGTANVACLHELPVAGVDLILGNDLAGGQMGNVIPPSVLRERPESTAELQQLEDDMPGVFALCAVTRSMSMTNDHNVTPVVGDSLSLGLFANPIASQDISFAVNAVTGKVALIAAQEQDDSLRLLFDRVSELCQ